jgi:hypothetical protein
MQSKSIITLSVSVLTIVALAVPGDVSGWAQWGPIWDPQDIPLRVEAHQAGTPDCTGVTEYGALRRAGATWNEVSCSFFSFKKGPGHPNNRPVPQLDGVNSVRWTFGLGGGVLAATWLWGFSDRQENDVEFNESISWSCSGNPGFNEYDTETVALHEFGHVLALDHTNNSNAVMWAFYTGVQRELHQDDINGICALYPAAGATAVEVEVQDLDF